MHIFLLARYFSFICIILLHLSVTVFAAWTFTALPAHSSDLGIVEPFLVIVGAMTVFFLPPIMMTDLSRRNALLSKAWFELAWVGILWVLDLAGGIRLALDADYFACEPTLLVPNVTVQGCIAPKILLGLVWAVDFLVLFHFGAVLILVIRTPRKSNSRHPLFTAIAENPLLQPSLPAFSHVTPASPSEKSARSRETRRKLMRRRASEQLTLNDGDRDTVFWGNDSADSDESIGPSIREIAAKEVLGLKGASERKRASSLPGQRFSTNSAVPPLPPLPAGFRASAVPLPVRQRQISMPFPLEPGQVRISLMPLPQQVGPAVTPYQPQYFQPTHCQPHYFEQSQDTGRIRMHSVPHNTAAVYYPTPLEAPGPRAPIRSHTTPAPGRSTSTGGFPYDNNLSNSPASLPPTPGISRPRISVPGQVSSMSQTQQTSLTAQQFYRFPTTAVAVAEVPPTPVMPKTPTASFPSASRSRSRGRRPSRAVPPVDSDSLQQQASTQRQTVSISAPLTSMPTFPEHAVRRLSQRPLHVPRQVTMPAPLKPPVAAWPATGASRVLSGLAYPEPAAVVSRRETEKKLTGERGRPRQPRKSYTAPSMLLGIANPSPTASPGPPTPSVYGPSPVPSPAPNVQGTMGWRDEKLERLRKDSLKDLESGNMEQTGAELYARYMAERYPSAL